MVNAPLILCQLKVNGAFIYSFTCCIVAPSMAIYWQIVEQLTERESMRKTLTAEQAAARDALELEVAA